MKLSVISGNEVVNDAAQYLWEHNKGDHGSEESPKTFADLDDADKLGLVEDYQRQVVVDCANTFKSNKAQDDARDLEAESKHTL